MYTKEEKARYMREYRLRNLDRIRAQHRIYMKKYRLRKRGIPVKYVEKSFEIPVKELQIIKEEKVVLKIE